MTTSKPYVLTASLIKRFKHSGFSLKCARCEKEFKENDKIISKIANKNGKKGGKRFHESCLKKLYYSSSDTKNSSKKKDLNT